MKNFLLTCFLALLCLVGRYLAASSKVADSPTEVPLHRSASVVSPHSGDTHRGGAILPDTFIEYTNGAEISSSPLPSSGPWTVDGGPILRSSSIGHGTSDIGHLTSDPKLNFGLVDSDQDMGAGEQTSNLDPAPVTVFASSLSEVRFPINQFSLELSGDEASVIGHRTPYNGHQTSLPSPVFGLPSSPKQTASLRASARSDDSRHPTPDIGHPTTLPLPDSLKIGDSLPPGLEVGRVMNQPDLKIRLDDYRGKYLMLVFWSPTCSGSIGALPRIDQLTQKYTDQLEVVPITVFPEERVAEVLKIYPSFQKLSLPIATDASYLRALFPHFRIPHVVLVDPEGKIKAITGAEDVTEKNLDMLFSSGTGNFRTKVDRKILLNPNEKLISENTHLENKNIWLQSAFTGYIPDVGGSLIQNYEGFSHIRITNMTPIYMFQLAYSERDLVDYYGVNRIETRGFEKDELTSDKSGADALAWMEEGNHVFGYELIAPPSYDPYQLMREDLRRYFPHIEVTVETQSRKVLALIRQEGRDFPPSAGKPRSYQSSPMGVRMTNYPLQGFVYHLNAAFWRASPTPIINLTGIDYPIDLQLDAPLGNYGRLREELQNNGLDLVEREEEIKILVLKKTAPFKSLTQ
jgi:thiol-disulfide isomerase/thioredoxin